MVEIFRSIFAHLDIQLFHMAERHRLNVRPPSGAFNGNERVIFSFLRVDILVLKSINRI